MLARVSWHVMPSNDVCAFFLVPLNVFLLQQAWRDSLACAWLPVLFPHLKDTLV